jgi:hypothetical protein
VKKTQKPFNNENTFADKWEKKAIQIVQRWKKA